MYYLYVHWELDIVIGVFGFKRVASMQVVFVMYVRLYFRCFMSSENVL